MFRGLLRINSGRSFVGVLFRHALPTAVLPLVAFALLHQFSSNALLYTTLFAAGLAAVASVVATARLHHPLKEMAESMDRSPADVAATVGEPPFSELDDIAQSFNNAATAFREANARLIHKAFHDPLTGLPNRALFMNRIQHALTSSTGHRDDRVALLFFDLDRFKVLNDTLGHVIGDRMLVMLSRRLSTLVKGRRMLARLAGDEFILLVQGQEAEAEAITIAEQIGALLRRPMVVDGRELFVSVSIGIAFSRRGETTSTELLRKADIALYRAKSTGRGRHTLYDPDIDKVSVERLDLDSALRRAVERHQLMLHYQPEVNLASGLIVGTEALLRWNHPYRGVLSPSDFISLAEETGEIVNIGQWVLEEACRKAGELNKEHPSREGFLMSLNLSGAEFWQEDLAIHVERILFRSGLDPRLLRLEITESVLMDHLPSAIETLNDLKRVGVKLAIDDFGTGYSSLSYLQRLPVDTLKIDQSFVRSLGRDERSLPIVAAIVQLGKALNMQVTAEGIETRQQLRLLSEVGCPFGQGFYFSPARDANTLAKMLERRPMEREAV